MEVGLIAVMAAAAQVAIAVVFLYAALSKVAGPASIQDTIERLGVSRSLSRPAGIAVIAAEGLTAVTLLTAPASWWPRALAGLLALAFAGAGAWAVATRRRVACRCFGNANTGTLGWQQVRALPMWLALVALAQWQPPSWSGEAGGVVLAFVIFGLMAWRGLAARGLVRFLRADRLAIAPGYTYYHPDNEEVPA